jgi:hypothetical protein
MNQLRLVLTICLVACFSAAVAGQDKKSPNVQDPPKGAKESPKTKAVQDLELAARLIQYGRSEKNAEALLVAAQILHKTPTEKLAVGSAVENSDKMAKPAAAAAVDDSPKALVAEAKKMSSSTQVAALATATAKMLEESTRGALGGPKIDAFTIRPGDTINWNPITFVGGQKAVVFIDNRVFGSMVLEVRDENGNVVARDNLPGTYFRVEFVPAWTGPFRIRLINIDTISFNCGMATN